jgi:SAM-dependent methyltransferase
MGSHPTEQPMKWGGMGMSESKISSQYVHGTHPEEQDRLARMNDFLNGGSLREIGDVKGKRILEVGSGLGQLARAFARSGAFVVGIERSSDQIKEAIRLAKEAGEENLVEFRIGDALALQLSEKEWGSFDIAHTRFLLEHVPKPEEVVRGMVRSVKPGGRIVLEDDPHDTLRLYPECPGLYTVWNAYIRAYDRLGNDPFVGHRLVALLHQGGAIPRRNSLVPFCGCQGSDIFDDSVNNLIGVLVGARDSVVNNGLLDAESFDRAMDEMDRWRRGPMATIWYAMSWAEGIRPLSGIE